jgi:hypothetical protein
MIAFLDFEASSLADDSYPIEVGWVFEDGCSETHLIRPAEGWIDWDDEAEEIHGLSRERLAAEGEPHDTVARRVLEALGEHEVFVSAPSWDGKWLSVLLRSAGLPRHAMRFKNSEVALADAAAGALRGRVAAGALDATIVAVIEQARRNATGWPVAHRALEDAEREMRLWREVRRLAEERAG